MINNTLLNFLFSYPRLIITITMLTLFTNGVIAQSSVSLTYSRDLDHSLSETIQYYTIDVSNINSSKTTYELTAALVDCNDGSLADKEVQFELNSEAGAVINSITVDAASKAAFTLKTTKIDLDTTSWSCIEIQLIPKGGSRSQGGSVVIKQLNPGNSNSK
ncbi:MAG: hypothetical protein VX319_11435 [Bacteroidota bacterium]|nr:hypothetical protein [Bacteroidota bacterium]